MRLALFQPDIPQNTGTLLRLGACLGVGVDIIEPAGFPLSHRSLRRAGMDYIDHADITRHMSWDAYRDGRDDGRIVLLTTRATQRHADLSAAVGLQVVRRPAPGDE